MVETPVISPSWTTLVISRSPARNGIWSPRSVASTTVIGPPEAASVPPIRCQGKQAIWRLLRSRHARRIYSFALHHGSQTSSETSSSWGQSGMSKLLMTVRVLCLSTLDWSWSLPRLVGSRKSIKCRSA